MEKDFFDERINDSKQLSEKKRDAVYEDIIKQEIQNKPIKKD